MAKAFSWPGYHPIIWSVQDVHGIVSTTGEHPKMVKQPGVHAAGCPHTAPQLPNGRYYSASENHTEPTKENEFVRKHGHKSSLFSASVCVQSSPCHFWKRFFSSNVCVCVFQRCFRYRYPSCVRRMAPNQVPGVVDMIRDILWLLYCWIYREQYRKYMENNMLWIGFNLQFSYVSSFILATQPTWPIIKKTHPGSWKGHFVHPKHKPPHGPPDHKCWLVEEMMPQPFLVFFCLPGSRHV